MNLTNFSSSNSRVEYVVFVCFLAPEYPRYLTWLVCCKVLKSVKDFNRFFYSLTWQYFFKELCFIVGEGIFFLFLKRIQNVCNDPLKTRETRPRNQNYPTILPFNPYQ